ncbi:hypothetical protein ACLB2K_035568 [Fragaria x ananassa]
MKGREEGHFFGRFTPNWEGRLANLFWRDNESLLDYNAFGDVVIIDSTYKTNIYSCLVILFVGSNNHRGTVLFASAIVADEKEATFSWVIEKFLQSMNNKHPITVLMDGDEVMRTVLKKLMPTTRHRLCAWHIGRNIGQNVKDVEVQKQLGKMVYTSYTIDEWEEAWGDIVAKHELEEDPWITALYEKRDRNVSVYPKSLIEDRWMKGGGRLKMVPTAAECVDEKSGRILRYTTLMCKAKKACHNLSQSTEGFDAGIVQLSGLTETG